MKKQLASLVWLVKSGLSALLVMLACGLATARFGDGLPLPSTQTRDTTLVTFDRYVHQPVPDVILVGSSMAFRLKEEYFATPRLRNLAIAGGSPVTGVSIVANRSALPKLVLVETNVMSRAIDEALVTTYSAGSKGRSSFLRPVKTLIAAYENWLHAQPSRAQLAQAFSDLLRQPPSNFDNRVYVDRALQQMNSENPAAVSTPNVKALEKLVDVLEQRGAHVLLFEMPYSEELEGSRYATVTRKLVHGAFPDAGHWLTLDFVRDDLRWADGVHVDERSGLIVARAIDHAIAPYLAASR
jgi:hypothetical protein